jgi:polysaccharide deacetylase 2 family uncharacterized protein YibQ
MDTRPSTSVQRRQRLKLPRRRWHVLGALTALLCAGLLIAFFLRAPAPNIDTNISGDLVLDPIPQPLAFTNLNSDETALPDLLAGDVEPGENPTELALATPKTDALGNVIGASPEPAAPSPTTRATSGVDGPKTILIDGKPIIGGSTELYSNLTTPGPYGPLPIKSADGNSALQAYSRPSRLVPSREPVSLVIGGLGVNRQLTQRAIDVLPADVTLSFAAHSNDLQNWIMKARADGHEVLIEIPMESMGFNPNDPAATRTLKAGDVQANKRHLDWLLSRAQGYFGVINYNGDRFLTRADAAAKTIDRFAQSGLGMISDGDFLTPTLPPLAQSVGLPYAKGFGLIDPEPNVQLITLELDRLASTAANGTSPIGVGFAYPETLQAVTAWIDTLPGQSLQLVPASYQLNK